MGRPSPSCPKTQTNSRLARRAVSIVIDPWRAPDLGVSEAMSAIRVLRTRRENNVQQGDATLPGEDMDPGPGPHLDQNVLAGYAAVALASILDTLGWPLFRRCTARSVPVLLLGANVALENRD